MTSITIPSTALPASLVALIAPIAEALTLLDDTNHLIIEAVGSNRFVQFATCETILRGESKGEEYLEGSDVLSPADVSWLTGHGWNVPDEGGNYWRHWDPATPPTDHLAAATVAIATLHMVHGVTDAAQLGFFDNNGNLVGQLRGVIR